MMKMSVAERFDASSTADEVAATVDLFGQLVVITGAAAGIGKETARALVRRGADLIIGGRNPQAIEAVSWELAGLGPGTLQAYEVDLLDLQSVGRFADSVVALGRAVDGLILNAGVMACPLSRSREGIEAQLATNFVGHALLTSRLVPALLKARSPRVVALSSTAHQMSPIVEEAAWFASQVGRGNLGLNICPLHLIRSGGTAAKVAALEPRYICNGQINDGHGLHGSASYFNEVHARELPGAGEFPLADILYALPPDTPVEVKIPSERRRQSGVSALDFAKDAATRSRSLLDTVASCRL
jgi:NAD(P)-dependent dehydrogenase (short-subunit alcohol dehydrogenase family)